MSSDQKIRAVNAWNELMLTMGTTFGLPKGFGIELSPQLSEWFKSDDPNKVEKFIEWVEKTTAELK